MRAKVIVYNTDQDNDRKIALYYADAFMRQHKKTCLIGVSYSQNQADQLTNCLKNRGIEPWLCDLHFILKKSQSTDIKFFDLGGRLANYRGLLDPGCVLQVFMGLVSPDDSKIISYSYQNETDPDSLLQGDASVPGSRKILSFLERHTEPTPNVIEFFIDKTPCEEALKIVINQIARLQSKNFTGLFLATPDDKIAAWTELMLKLQRKPREHPSIVIAEWKKQRGGDIEKTRTALKATTSPSHDCLKLLKMWYVYPEARPMSDFVRSQRFYHHVSSFEQKLMQSATVAGTYAMLQSIDAAELKRHRFNLLRCIACNPIDYDTFEYFAFSLMKMECRELSDIIVCSGRIDFLDNFIEKYPESIRFLFSHYETLAPGGDLDMMNRLLEITSQKRINIKQQLLFSFYDAVYNGKLNIVNRLFEVAFQYGVNITDMILEAVQRQGFYMALRNHPPTAKRLLEVASQQDIMQDVLSVDNYTDYWESIGTGSSAVSVHAESLVRSLRFSSCFAYAEMYKEYQKWVDLIISEQLDILRLESYDHLATSSNVAFDITDLDRTTLCFYIARHIIRRNDRVHDDDLRFLLNIPAVRNLALTVKTSGPSPELLQLAQTVNNQMAVECLLKVPAVQILDEPSSISLFRT